MEVTFLKKKYQEKWENAYLTVKSSPASGALSGPPRPPAYRAIHLQSKPNEENKDLWFSQMKKRKITFIKMITIFHAEIDIS